MSVDYSNWTNWTDKEWCEYLLTSSDLDDRSLAWRLGLVDRLKTRSRLNQRETQLFQLLLSMNSVELAYLKNIAKGGPSAARARAHGRPCWPRWHWPDDLEQLFLRTM